MVKKEVKEVKEVKEGSKGSKGATGSKASGSGKSSGKSSSGVASTVASTCEKLNVILDIDETLVYFIHKRYFPHSWDLLTPAEKAKYQVKANGSGVFIVRPHLDTFLRYLFKHFNVSLWTLSDKEYADGIAKMFVVKNTKRKLVHVLNADEHGDLASDLHGNNKDLNMLWYHAGVTCFSECNTILIDDLSHNTLNPSNRKNAITINPFALFGEVKARTDPYHDVSQDDTLLQLIDVLTKVNVAMHGCFRSGRRWDNVFTKANIKDMGLEDRVQSLRFKNNTVKAVCVGLGVPRAPRVKTPPTPPKT